MCGPIRGPWWVVTRPDIHQSALWVEEVGFTISYYYYYVRTYGDGGHTRRLNSL